MAKNEDKWLANNAELKVKIRTLPHKHSTLNNWVIKGRESWFPFAAADMKPVVTIGGSFRA